MSKQTSPPTIILGGGFVGLFTALHLVQHHYQRPLILIEQRDRFTFKPLLYELLTGELHSEQVCPRYQDLLAKSRVSVVQDAVKSLDLPQRRVYLASGQVYDYGNLVLALGSVTSYLNISGAADNALPFTSAEEARTLKMRLQDCLQTAVQTRDIEQRSHLLTVAVIGAGPAGVELACTLADILPIWYEAIGGNYEEIRVVLVNRGHEILKGDINSRLRQTAKYSLKERTVKVELLLDAVVTAITPMGVAYKKEQESHFLPAMTIAWTGGTAPHPLLQELPIAPEKRHQRGQLQVTSTLQLSEFPEVFVGGDCAYLSDNPQPPTAQVAYQQGKAIADNLQAISQGKKLTPVQVNLRGTLMKLGLGEGAANIFNRVELKGEIGHLIRHATYLELLPKPLHNFKVTAEWLTDELLQRHQPQSLNPNHYGKTPILAGVTATLAGIMIAMPLIWRAAQPEQFHQTLGNTGIPTLLNKVTLNHE